MHTYHRRLARTPSTDYNRAVPRRAPKSKLLSTPAASFDLQKHVAEAVVENIYSHIVGLVGHPPVFLGSAIAIRWNGHTLLVTADHVLVLLR